MKESTPATAADVANNVVDKLSAGIESLAHAFAKVAPHAWQVLVRQQIVEGAVTLGWLLCLLVIFIVFCQLTRKLHAKFGFVFDSEVPTIALGSLVITLVLGLLTAHQAFDVPIALSKLINPEYYAAQDLCSLVSKN